MAEIIVATLSITFDDQDSDSRGALKLEIDDREDGLNNGNTSFKPGDQPGYFLFRDNNVTLIEGPLQTFGGPSALGTGIKEVDENITFSNSDSSSLGYPPNVGSVTRSWVGRSWRVEGASLVIDSSIPEVVSGTSELRTPAGKKMIGVLNCKYDSRGNLYRANGVPTDIKEIMVVAVGQVNPSGV